MNMTDQIRKAVDARLTELGKNRAQLARETDLALPNLSRLLAGRSGKVPESWQRVLDAVGLELVAVPKGTDVSVLVEGQKGE